MKIPSLILKQLYTFGSLENTGRGVRFGLKNRLSDAMLIRVGEITIDGRTLPLDEVVFDLGSDGEVAPADVSDGNPVEFPLSKIVSVVWRGAELAIGKHTIGIAFETSPFGNLSFRVKDAIREHTEERITVPYDKEDNYSDEIIGRRRDFVQAFAGSEPEHLYRQSFDPRLTEGNIENFVGVAQVPIGLAGPVKVNGEHAKGEFVVPLATTEGTLVASYNRGIKVLNLAGGATATVSDDRMQRAPVFVFDSAREARDFRGWVEENMGEIRRAAEATSSVARLLDIDIFLANKFAYLRFNYSTGDAAGQNMVTLATQRICDFILAEAPVRPTRSYVEGNLSGDKKASAQAFNTVRGKKTIAEATLPADLVQRYLHTTPEAMTDYWRMSALGGVLSGTIGVQGHFANGLAALFIACGQDPACVAESAVGVTRFEVTEEGALYAAVTLPNLMLGTVGGGTGLPTQRACLDLLGLSGAGKSGALAEVTAALVLAGELSIIGAMAAGHFARAHERRARSTRRL